MENAIQTELDKEIKSLTAPEAAPVTLWTRIATWWALRRMPKGQRMWALGFKPVNRAQLRERFSLDLIAKQLNKETYDRKLREKGLSTVDVEISDVTTFSSMRDVYFRWKVLPTSIHFNTKVSQSGYEHLEWAPRLQEAVIKMVPLSEYIGDRIPSRCMADVKRAKAWGCGKMYVAFPAIQEVPQRDPVILTKWSGGLEDSDATFLEISWWE